MMRTGGWDVRWLGACALIAMGCGPTDGTSSKTSDEWAEGGNNGGDGGGNGGDGDGDGDGDGGGNGGDGSGGGNDDADRSDGCGEDSTGISTILDIDGQSRSFDLSLPSSYDSDRAYPLVFAWHGLGGSGGVARSYFGLQDQVGSNAIIVYPDALVLAGYDGKTGWELNPTRYDFDFFDGMYTHLTTHLCIDKARVFSTGHSFGGYMSNSVGCYRADVHNAIAPVAGGPMFFGGCQGTIGVWITHGSADDVVEPSQGHQARDKWLINNGCSDTSAATAPSPCVAYDDCSRPVHYCEHTGEHEWPSFAAEAIWEFFSAQ